MVFNPLGHDIDCVFNNGVNSYSVTLQSTNIGSVARSGPYLCCFSLRGSVIVSSILFGRGIGTCYVTLIELWQCYVLFYDSVSIMYLFVQLTLIGILIVETTGIALKFMEPKLVMSLFRGPGIG